MKVSETLKLTVQQDHIDQGDNLLKWKTQSRTQHTEFSRCPTERSHEATVL